MDFIFLWIICTLGSVARADILVEATSLREDRIEPSRSSTVLQEAEIQTSGVGTIGDLLRSVPGLEVLRQGGVGQVTSVFIRGARSEDTLVLIDGVEVNDAMSAAGGFDFSNIMLSDVERVEVYRGPQGVRFGSGALGGVINIVTKGGASRPRTRYRVEAGSFQTDREALSHQGKMGSVSLERFATQGFSSAAGSASTARTNGLLERDGVEVRSASGKVAWQGSRSLEAQGTLRYADTQTEIDTTGGAAGDDPNNQTRGRQWVAGVSATDRFAQDRLRSTLGFYYGEMDRSGRNEPDARSATESTDHFWGENKKIQNAYPVVSG